MKFVWSIFVLISVVITTHHAHALTLYSTEFEEFSVGDDKWVGTNGWLGTSTGVGAHGIDTNILPGLSKTAFIGFNKPKQTFVTVFRPLLYDPVSNATPIVEFESQMGIVDSTNGHRDTFFFTFYNSAGSLLASIRLDNTALNYGIWRLDGTNQFDTGVDFVRAQLHLLFASINFSNNTWNADLDGIPLFTGAQFNATGKPRDLGYVAAEWQLTGPTTNDYGNNWMLIADWAVRVFPLTNTTFSVEQTGVNSNGSHAVNWTGTVGFDYATEYSDDLKSWHTNLANSVYTNILSKTPLTFTDASNLVHRFYRVSRSLAP